LTQPGSLQGEQQPRDPLQHPIAASPRPRPRLRAHHPDLPEAVGPLTCEAVSPAHVSDEWRELALQSTNVFATYEWAQTWWAHFGAGRQRLTLMMRTGSGTPVAIVPLYIDRLGPLRILRFIGDGSSDELGPVCAPEHVPPVGRAFAAFLEESREWNVLIARTMPGDLKWNRVLGASTLNREGSPTVHLRGVSWDDFVAAQSKHFRKRVFSAERRLQRDHGMRWRTITAADELPEALDHFFRLHTELRGGRPSSFLGRGSFHRAFMAKALEAGWLRLRIMELDGSPAAGVLDYSHCGVVRGYQLGRADKWKRLLHIRLLVVSSIRQAFDEGAVELRMGRGGEQYKYQFATTDAGVETLVKGRGVLGQGVAWSMYRGRGLRPFVRRLQKAAARFTAPGGGYAVQQGPRESEA